MNKEEKKSSKEFREKHYPLYLTETELTELRNLMTNYNTEIRHNKDFAQKVDYQYKILEQRKHRESKLKEKGVRGTPPTPQK